MPLPPRHCAKPRTPPALFLSSVNFHTRIFLPTKKIGAMDSLFDGSLTSLVAGAAISIVSLNLIFTISKTFKRDSVGNSFGNVVTGSVSLLQNKDSVLKREEVKDSMDGYDNLFAGARKDVGSIHSKESIEKRQKEYQTMVNSFYNLVTDFYEWGWGQVRFQRVIGP